MTPIISTVIREYLEYNDFSFHISDRMKKKWRTVPIIGRFPVCWESDAAMRAVTQLVHLADDVLIFRIAEYTGRFIQHEYNIAWRNSTPDETERIVGECRSLYRYTDRSAEYNILVEVRSDDFKGRVRADAAEV